MYAASNEHQIPIRNNAQTNDLNKIISVVLKINSFNAKIH